MLGHNIRTPLAVIKYQWTGEKIVKNPFGRYLVRLVEGMEEMRQLAKENQEVYKQNYKKKYDKKAKPRSSEVGDLVLVRDHNKLQGFKKETCGPYPVMEVLAGNNYKLHMPDNPRRHSRLHVNMLEKYVTPIAECLWTDEDLQDLGPQMLGGAIGDVPEPEMYLEKEDRRKLRKLLVEYKDIFQSKPGRTSTTKIEIITADAYPIHLPAYRVPPIKLPMLEQEVKSLLEEGPIHLPAYRVPPIKLPMLEQEVKSLLEEGPIHLPAYRVPPIKLPMLEQEVKSLLEEGPIHLPAYRVPPIKLPMLEQEVKSLLEEGPIHLPAYRVPPIKLPMLEQEVKSLLEEGIIEPSSSQWASPTIIVPKPNGGTRLCIDYRKLNKITTPDVFPMPLIEDLIERLAQSKVISVLDVAKGYYQVPVHPNSVDKTAFVTPLGKYRVLVVPFVLCRAQAVFQHLMNTVLDGLVKFSSCYIDDIAVYSDSIIDHFEHLREVFTRLRVHGLTVKPIKCQLFHRRVTYLGHLVGGGEVRPLLPKIQVLKEFLRPKTKRQLRYFLGLSNYVLQKVHEYIEHYADKAHTLYDALKRNEPDSIVWNESSERAFLKLKNELTEETVLMAPQMDRSFILSTDAWE